MLDSTVLKRIIKFIGNYYEVNKFYLLLNKNNCSYSIFFTKKHVSSHITIVEEPIVISGVCEAYRLIDSRTLSIGYIFVTLKVRTKITPIMLSVKIPPDQDKYVEVQLPPKFGVLAYKSTNGSTLIIAQEELSLQYIIKDVT